MEASLPEVLLEHAVTRSLASGSASPKTPKPEANSSPDGKSALLVSHFKEMKLNSTLQDGYSEFLEPDDVSTEFIKISLAPSYQFVSKTCIKYKDNLLQLRCKDLRIQFGASTKYLDNAGCPKLSILVDIPKNLCKVLEFCDGLAQRSSQESGSISKWRPLIKKYDYINHPTIRLNIPTIRRGDAVVYSTDIYQKQPSGNIQKLVFNHVDVPGLDSLFVQGNKVDGLISLDTYDYQRNAGIRLVAKELLVHPIQ